MVGGPRPGSRNRSGTRSLVSQRRTLLRAFTRGPGPLPNSTRPRQAVGYYLATGNCRGGGPFLGLGAARGAGGSGRPRLLLHAAREARGLGPGLEHALQAGRGEPMVGGARHPLG